MEEQKIETKAMPDPAAEQEGSVKKGGGNVFKEIRDFREQVKEFNLNDLIVPAMSLLILLLLTTFVYIPSITSAITFRQESEEVTNKIEQLEKLNEKLDQINVSQLQQDLSVARKVIPFSLQVSDFAFYVDNLAKQKNLVFKEILAGDVQVKAPDEESGIDPVVRGVSGPLKYTGTLSDITAFLDQLQNASPFMIAADDIKLRKSVDSDSWEVALSITGFYINESSIPQPNIYSPFSEYSQNSDVLEIFKDKAQQLESGQTSD
jgi:hypothetical protein